MGGRVRFRRYVSSLDFFFHFPKFSLEEVFLGRSSFEYSLNGKNDWAVELGWFLWTVFSKVAWWSFFCCGFLVNKPGFSFEKTPFFPQFLVGGKVRLIPDFVKFPLSRRGGEDTLDDFHFSRFGFGHFLGDKKNLFQKMTGRTFRKKKVGEVF